MNTNQPLRHGLLGHTNAHAKAKAKAECPSCSGTARGATQHARRRAQGSRSTTRGAHGCLGRTRGKQRASRSNIGESDDERDNDDRHDVAGGRPRAQAVQLARTSITVAMMSRGRAPRSGTSVELERARARAGQREPDATAARGVLRVLGEDLDDDGPRRRRRLGRRRIDGTAGAPNVAASGAHDDVARRPPEEREANEPGSMT